MFGDGLSSIESPAAWSIAELDPVRPRAALQFGLCSDYATRQASRVRVCGWFVGAGRRSPRCSLSQNAGPQARKRVHKSAEIMSAMVAWSVATILSRRIRHDEDAADRDQHLYRGEEPDLKLVDRPRWAIPEFVLYTLSISKRHCLLSRRYLHDSSCRGWLTGSARVRAFGRLHLACFPNLVIKRCSPPLCSFPHLVSSNELFLTPKPTARNDVLRVSVR